MVDWLTNSINISEIFGSFVANMLQWLIIGLLLFRARTQGKRINNLKDSNRSLEGVLFVLFGEVVQLPEQARIQCKSLLRDVANDINRTGVTNFGQEEVSIAKSAMEEFWFAHGKKLKKLPQAESKFSDFSNAMSLFLENTGNPTSKSASPGLKREYGRIKESWKVFFEIAFANLPLDEQERKDLNDLSIGHQFGDSQLFFNLFRRSKLATTELNF